MNKEMRIKIYRELTQALNSLSMAYYELAMSIETDDGMQSSRADEVELYHKIVDMKLAQMRSLK